MTSNQASQSSSVASTIRQIISTCRPRQAAHQVAARAASSAMPKPTQAPRQSPARYVRGRVTARNPVQMARMTQQAMMRIRMTWRRRALPCGMVRAPPAPRTPSTSAMACTSRTRSSGLMARSSSSSNTPATSPATLAPAATRHRPQWVVYAPDRLAATVRHAGESGPPRRLGGVDGELIFARAGFGAAAIGYLDGWELQRRGHERRRRGEIAGSCLLLEHPPVYTAGKRTTPLDRPVGDPGAPVIDVDRGGNITWHGPGQLVGYPIVALGEPIDVISYVSLVEAALIGTCAEFGVAVTRVDGR